jgi:SSS family transporter
VGTGFNYVVDGGIILVYLATLTAIGLHFSKRQSSIEDFFLARRGMSWLPVGLSLMAALNSGIDYVMQPSATIRFGYLIIIGTVSWFALVPWVSYVTLPFFHRMHIYSAYEYLERRFSVGVRTLTAVIFILWRLGWMATALYVPCLAISAATKGALPVVPLALVLGTVVTVYTMLGGIRAVVWTDVLQFCIMFGGLAVAVGVIVSNLPGGFGEVFATATANGKWTLNPAPLQSPGTGLLGEIGNFFRTEVSIVGLIIAAVVGRMAGYTGDQVMIQRLQTTKNVAEGRRSFTINAVADAVWMIVLAFVGLALFAYLQHHPVPADMPRDRVFPQFISEVFPVGLTGLLIAAILAASLSSVDSAINSVSTVAVVDFYNRLYLKKIQPGVGLTEQQQRQQVLVSRVATVILGIAATILAANVGRIGDLIEIANKLIQQFTGPILGIFFLGMFTTRARSTGVLVGGIAGAAVAMYVAFFSKLSWMWPSTFGFMTTFFLGLLVSAFCGKPTPQEQEWTYDAILQLPEPTGEPEPAAASEEPGGKDEESATAGASE